MRWFCLACGLGALTACTPTPVEGRVAPSPPTVQVDSEDGPPAAAPAPVARGPLEDPRLLPAGRYFRLDLFRPCRYVDASEDDGLCITPTTAVVTGLYRTVAALKTDLGVADRAGLPPGYPFVVDAAALGIAADGIAVVVGLFAESSAAESWQRRLPMPTALHAVSADSEGLPYNAPRATRLVDREVTAWRGPRLDGPEAEGERVAACTLPAGTPLVVPYGGLGEYVAVDVTCPDGPAWVRWQDTRLETVVRRVDGGYEGIQLVGAECDQPIFQRWPWRTPVAKRQPVSSDGGC